MPNEGNNKNFFVASIIFLFVSILFGTIIYYIKKERLKGVIYSCRGWELNKLPEVKNFIKYDLKYFNVDIFYSGGKPRLVIYSSNKKEIETIDLSPYNRKQLFELFKLKGLKK